MGCHRTASLWSSTHLISWDAASTLDNRSEQSGRRHSQGLRHSLLQVSRSTGLNKRVFIRKHQSTKMLRLTVHNTEGKIPSTEKPNTQNASSCGSPTTSFFLVSCLTVAFNIPMMYTCTTHTGLSQNTPSHEFPASGPTLLVPLCACNTPALGRWEMTVNQKSLAQKGHA